MANIFLKPNADIDEIVAKINEDRGTDVTLVFPNGSKLFSDEASLEILKIKTDELGKKISFFLQDQNIAQLLVDTGFNVRGTRRPVMRRAKPKVEPRIIEQEVIQQPAPFEHLVIEPEIQQPAQVNAEPVYHAKPRVISAVAVARSRKKRRVVASLVALVILALLLGTFVLPQASLNIYAHSQPLSRDLEISLSKDFKVADTKQLQVPAQIVDKDQQGTKTFSSTGKQNVGIKARGIVSITNNTGKILKLNAATTELSVDKRVFRLEKDVSGIKQSMDVAIIADQAGDEYNIPAVTRFEISNQVLGKAPQLLYATNLVALSGGVSRFTSNISQEDIDSATKELKDTLFNSAKQQLLNTQGLTLNDALANFEVKNISFDKKAGDQSLSFTGSATGHLKALVYNYDSLKKLIEQRILMTLEQGQVLATEKKEDITVSFKNIDITAGTAIAMVHVDSVLVSKVDPKSIKAQVRGKSLTEIKDLLLSDPKIDGLDIEMSPFWVRNAPAFSGRIFVNVTSK